MLSAAADISAPPVAATVAAALETVGLVSRSAEWDRLSGGRTNMLWLVSGRGTPLVVKLFSPGGPTPLFPNNGAAEARVLGALSGEGLTPDLCGAMQTPAGFAIVYKHLPGPVWRSGVEEVASCLARVHEFTAPEGLRTLASGSQALMAQTLEILAGCSTDMAAELRQRAPRHPDVPATDAPCLVHGDVVPNNIIRTKDGLRLIDWQCPASGDATEDIAIFLSPAMQLLHGAAPLRHDQVCRFHEASARPAIAERYRALAPWYHWRMAAYCLWKAERGATDYANAMALEIQSSESG